MARRSQGGPSRTVSAQTLPVLRAGTYRALDPSYACAQEGIGRAAEISAIEGEVITVTFEGKRGTRRFRNHETARLGELVKRFGSQVLVHIRYALMQVEGCCFSIAPNTGRPLTACSGG